MFWTEWRNHANCAGVYCIDCPVAKWCERYATETQSAGTWGGTTHHYRMNNYDPANPVVLRWT